MQRGECVVVDVETTGLSPKTSRITEIAAVRLREGKIIDEFSTLVNPECDIPRFITRITGIDNSLVCNAPVIRQVLPMFYNFLGKDPFVAHNAPFDLGFINHNSDMYYGKLIDNDIICTMRLARKVLPKTQSKKLSSLCSLFNIENPQSHRALSDARATATLYFKLCQYLATRQ